MRRPSVSISRAAAGGAAALAALAVGPGPAAAATVQHVAPTSSGVGAEVEHHNGNAGDIWVDQAGTPAGPGHENDPQLSACSAVTVWGAGMADGGGTLTIESIPPTPAGHSLTLSWGFPGGRAPRPLVTVDAVALEVGLTPAGHGDHFRVVLEQDPRKSKDFWLTPCAPTSGAVRAARAGVLAATAAATPAGHVAIGVPSTGATLPALSAILLAGGMASLLLARAGRRGTSDGR